MSLNNSIDPGQPRRGVPMHKAIAHASFVRRPVSSRPNLMTIAAGRDLDVCVAESLDDSLRPSSLRC
jgi:hypothetical protein